jgi:hypothetical protein
MDKETNLGPANFYSMDNILPLLKDRGFTDPTKKAFAKILMRDGTEKEGEMTSLEKGGVSLWHIDEGIKLIPYSEIVDITKI